MGWLRRIGDKLSVTPDQNRAQQLRQWASSFDGTEQIAVCRTRNPVKVAGVVESIKVVPLGGTAKLEVQVYDGTDKVTAVFLGRRRVEGIQLGMGLILEGMLIKPDEHSPLEMINPAYTLAPRTPSRV